MNTAVSVVALLLALAALGLEVSQRLRRARQDPADVSDLPEDALGLRHEVAALRAEAANALRNLAVVRYDAFGGGPSSGGSSAGGLSWSLALLDDRGNGVVMTSIHGRTEARTYAKTIASWACEQPLSPEESEAVTRARPR
ncbi:MAG TPA: DUF4446 family protein [Marmoricola sp.]|nr:DUF4446 family protein [Marmoricola sp.]